MARPSRSSEPPLGSHAHRDGHRPVQLDHRRRRHLGEVVVERGDRPPVGVRGGGGPHVLAGDRRLKAVDPDPSRARGAAERRLALGDQLAVPQPPILIVEQDRHTVGSGPRGCAGMVEEHQRHEPGRLRLIRQQAREHAGEADRLGAQLLADGRIARRGGVPLVEDQVQHGHHLVETLGDDRLGRVAKPDPGHAQAALRAHEPLRHDGLRDEEGARDLGRREAAGQPQRERHLGVGRERRVAAGEDQLEAVIGQAVVRKVRGGLRARLLELRQLQRQRPVAPEPVERHVAGGCDHPGGRLGGNAVDRPAGRGAREGLLHRLLRQVGVAEPAPQRTHRPRPVIAERSIDGGAGEDHPRR